MTTSPHKARGTVRPEPCCQRAGAGACWTHAPNVSLEVRRGGKWIHMGVLTPEHQWVIPVSKKAARRALEAAKAIEPKEAVPA